MLYVSNSPINSFDYLHNSASNLSNLAFTMRKVQGIRCQHFGVSQYPQNPQSFSSKIPQIFLETDRNIPINWSETGVIILQHDPVSPATVYSWGDTWLRLNQMIPALGTWGKDFPWVPQLQHTKCEHFLKVILYCVDLGAAQVKKNVPSRGKAR